MLTFGLLTVAGDHPHSLTGKGVYTGQNTSGRRHNPNDCASQAGGAKQHFPVCSGSPPNAELRTREYLTPAEVEKLMREARQGRYGHRDATLILIAFRHGLRASEICDLEWSQVEFGRSASLHVRRAKNGKPSVHPLRGEEIRALRELRRQFPESGFVFATERGGPFTTDAVNRLIKRIGERAGFAFLVHAHMLRHGCGYALANKGHDTRAIQDWLGHRSIQHTVRYTELSPTRFKDFWR
jgi:type 1 fimbriae regulatory protein FimB/type 1 fimbriae regulatory protein FimE